MERPVGDKFKLNGCVYVVVEDASLDFVHSCGRCAFSRVTCENIISVTGNCTDEGRRDRKAVHFEHFGVDW